MRLRRTPLLIAFSVALAAAPAAPGAPTLSVSLASPSLDALSDATISVALDSAPAAATARLAVYAPAGTTLRMRRSPGREVGRVVSALVDVGGGHVFTNGTVTVRDPIAYLSDPCAPGVHAGVWLVQLTGPGVDVSVPVFVDEVDDPGEHPRGAYRLEACLPASPRIGRLELELDEAVRTPFTRGTSSWRAIVTPYGTDGTADAAGAVEARALVPLPVDVELTGRYDFAYGSATLAGRVRVAGSPLRRTSLELLTATGRAEPAAGATVRTNGAGRFELQQDIRRRTVFRLEASLPSEDVTAQACSDPVVPAGCVSATRGPVTVRSETLAVRVSRPPTLRLGDRGPEVVMLQKRLTELRYLPARSANGSFDWRTWHAVVAFQGWQLLPRDGEVSGGFWKSLERARPPRPWGGLKDGLQIDRERQVAFLVEQGEVRRAIHVSTGAGGATPAGQFAVYRKETLSWSVPFKAWLPWASYFTGGIALHEYPSVPAYAASHGCVRVPADEARIVYSFAGEGTSVWVR